MTESSIISICSLVVTIITVVLGFLLQRDNKKVRDVERENKKLKSNLLKSIMAIKGYQLLEQEYAKDKNIDVSIYRRQIRKDKNDFFDTNFLSPSNINRLLENTAD